MGTNQQTYSDLNLTTPFVNQSPRIVANSTISTSSPSTSVFENVHYIPHVNSLLHSPVPAGPPRQQHLLVGGQTFIQSSPTTLPPQHQMRFQSSLSMQMPLNASPQRIRAILPPTPRPTPTASISLPPTPVRSLPPTGKVRDEFFKRKHHLLKKCIKSLVFKNAALSDEVARLHQRITTVTEERKVLLRKLLTHEKRRASLAMKKAAKRNRTLSTKIENLQENATIVTT